jgi:hypothetical protein
MAKGFGYWVIEAETRGNSSFGVLGEKAVLQV